MDNMNALNGINGEHDGVCRGLPGLKIIGAQCSDNVDKLMQYMKVGWNLLAAQDGY